MRRVHNIQMNMSYVWRHNSTPLSASGSSDFASVINLITELVINLQTLARASEVKSGQSHRARMHV